MTDDELDQLLDLAAKRFTARAPLPDAGRGLRGLARDVAGFRGGTYRPAPWWDAVTRARPKLDSLSRWVLNQPDSMDALRRWAETSSDLDRAPAEPLDFDQLAELGYHHASPRDGAAGMAECDQAHEPLAIVGARVFGCLLHQTGHPVSAAFWWRFAAGDQDRIAAYCLYLLYLGRGDLHQAQAWFEDAIPAQSAPRSGIAPLENFPRLLDACVGSAEVHDGRDHQPGAGVRRAVDRLVEASAHQGDDQGIAARPDRELARSLAEMAGHH
jgi:hypothetical protein